MTVANTDTIQDEVWQYLATLPFEVSAPVMAILCRHDSQLTISKGINLWMDKHREKFYSDDIEFRFQIEAGKRVSAIILALPELLAAVKRADRVLFRLSGTFPRSVNHKEIGEAWRQLADAMMKAKIV